MRKAVLAFCLAAFASLLALGGGGMSIMMRRNLMAAKSGDPIDNLPWQDYLVCNCDLLDPASGHPHICFMNTNLTGVDKYLAAGDLYGGYERHVGKLVLNSTYAVIGGPSFPLPMCFRILVDCKVKPNPGITRYIIDNSVRNAPRGIEISIRDDGTWAYNTKLGGNASAPIFNPDPSPVYFDRDSEYSGVFEVGVIPKDNGYCVYRRLNHDYEYYGAVVPASAFSLVNMDTFYLFRAYMSSSYGFSTGEIYSVAFQTLAMT